MTTAEFRKQMDEEEAECNRVAAAVVAAGCIVNHAAMGAILV